MTFHLVQTGTYPNDGTGDTLRVSFNKINENFIDVYNNLGYLANNSNVINAAAHQNYTMIFDQANAAFYQANSAQFLTVQVEESIGYAYLQSNLAYIAANGTVTNTASAFARANLIYDTANNLSQQINDSTLGLRNRTNNIYTFANTIYTTLNDPINGLQSKSNLIYAFANVIHSKVNSNFVVSNTSFDRVNTVFQFANGIYNWANSVSAKADSKLANTSGAWFNGSLNIPGSMNVKQDLQVTGVTILGNGIANVSPSGSVFRSGPSGYGIRVVPRPGADALVQQAVNYLNSSQTKSNADFITGAYNLVLGRVPDTGGYNFWLTNLNTNKVTRQDVINSFLASIEFNTLNGSGVIQFTNAEQTTVTGSISVNQNGFQIGPSQRAPLSFTTGGVLAAQIDLNQNFIVENGSVVSNSFVDIKDSQYFCRPSLDTILNRLSVGNDSYIKSYPDKYYRMKFDNGGATYIYGGLVDQQNIQFGTSDGNIFSLFTGTGDFFTDGNVTAYYSDKRLKRNVEKIGDWRSILNGINGYRFQWNDLGKKILKKNDDEVEIGFLAQELKEVLPQAAVVQMTQYKEIKDGVGVPKDDIDYDPENPYLTVKPEKIVPVLLEAVKGLMEEIDGLKAEIKELKSAREK